jgi:hypothetical protein
MRIRISKRPPGEAPESIRDCWVGVTLTVSPSLQDRRKFRGVGVLSGPSSWLGSLFAYFMGRTAVVNGYAVDAGAAVEELSKHAPQAATWWRENVPHLLAPGRRFVFATEACEALTEETPNKALKRTREG